MRCCRSDPRCKACPIRLHRELRELSTQAAGAVAPAHLAGVPECLHKYGPLFDRGGGSAQGPR